jgi:3-oxoacyl-[acyl-carrier protein] reductase
MTVRTAVVTGAGSGIGRAAAVRLGLRGLRVVCVGRTASTLEETVAIINDGAGEGVVAVADCGDGDAWEGIFAAVGSEPLQTLIHCAAKDQLKAFADLTRSDYDRMFDLNVAGPLFITQRLLPNLVEGSSVVFVGSVASRAGMPKHALYGASKAALKGLTVGLAVDLAPRIRVNMVSPGATDTALLAAYIAESYRDLSAEQAKRQQAAAASRQLLRRVATPDEVAATVVHVALDATAMTGQDVSVDLGYTAS